MVFAYLLIILVQVFFFLVLVALTLYFLSMMISDIFGVPFVPTRQRNLEKIFSEVKIKKTDRFYDLGCGDGRLVFFVAKHFGAHSTGIELNPLLNWYSRILKKLTKNHLVEFRRENIFNTDLKKATVIYLFLFPEVVEKLKDKFFKECKPGTIIISHGFEAKFMKHKQIAFLAGNPFKTFYYRL